MDVPPRVERKISEIRDAAVERDRPAPRQRMVADVPSAPPPTRVIRHRSARAAIPAPKPAPAPPPRTPATAPPPAAKAFPPVSGVSLLGSVRLAVEDRIRSRLAKMKPETLLMAITIAEMLEDE